MNFRSAAKLRELERIDRALAEVWHSDLKRTNRQRWLDLLNGLLDERLFVQLGPPIERIGRGIK